MTDNDFFETKTTIEVWTYGGVRTIKGKRFYLWLDANGEELLYSKTHGTTVGGMYEIKVERDDVTDKCAVHGQPRYTGDRNDDKELRLKLMADHTITTTRLAILSMERSDAKKNDLDKALEPLIQLAKGIRVRAERDALLAHIIRKVSEAW